MTATGIAPPRTRMLREAQTLADRDIRMDRAAAVVAQGRPTKYVVDSPEPSGIPEAWKYGKKLKCPSNDCK